MLFDRQGNPVVQMNRIQVRAPSLSSPAEAVALRKTWGIEVEATLQRFRSRYPGENTVRLTLPVLTCRGSWVFKGKELLVEENVHRIDFELARRTWAWLEFRRERFVEEAQREKTRWWARGYTQDMVRWIDRFIERTQTSGIPVGQNRLGQYLSLQTLGRTTSRIDLNPDSIRLVKSALPLVGEHATPPPWAPRALENPVYDKEEKWAALHDQLPTVELIIQSDSRLNPGSVLLSQAALEKLRTPVMMDGRELNTKRSELPVPGDPLVLIDASGRAREVRLADVHPDPSAEVLANAKDCSPEPTWVMASSEARSPRASMRDIPDRVLACDALAREILWDKNSHSDPVEWGVRWHAPSDPDQGWTGARTLQNLMALYSRALCLGEGGVHMIPVSRQDLESVSRDAFRVRSDPRLADGICNWSRLLGPRYHVGLPWRNGVVPGGTHRIIDQLGLPMLSFLAMPATRKLTPLGAALNAYNSLSQTSSLRNQGGLRHREEYLARVWDLAGKELQDFFMLGKSLPGLGWTPVVNSPDVDRSVVELSPDLFAELYAPVGNALSIESKVLVVGERACELSIRMGSGRACIRVHPDVHNRLGSAEVFTMIPGSATSRGTARRFVANPPELPEACFWDALIANTSEEILRMLEHFMDEQRFAPLDHPSTRRVLGWLDHLGDPP